FLHFSIPPFLFRLYTIVYPSEEGGSTSTLLSVYPPVSNKHRERLQRPSTPPFTSRCFSRRFPTDRPATVGFLPCQQVCQMPFDLFLCKQPPQGRRRRGGKV